MKMSGGQFNTLILGMGVIMLVFVLYTTGGLAGLGFAPAAIGYTVAGAPAVVTQTPGGQACIFGQGYSSPNVRAYSTVKNVDGTEQAVTDALYLYREGATTYEGIYYGTTGFATNSSVKLPCGANYKVCTDESTWDPICTPTLTADLTAPNIVFAVPKETTFAMRGYNETSTGTATSTTITTDVTTSETESGDYIELQANAANSEIPANSLVLCAAYETTNFTSIQVSGGTAIGTPGCISTAAISGQSAFSSPGIVCYDLNNPSTTHYGWTPKYQLILNAKSGVNPGGAAASYNFTNITLTLTQKTGYLLNGQLNTGVCDETNTLVGPTKANFVIQVT